MKCSPEDVLMRHIMGHQDEFFILIYTLEGYFLYLFLIIDKLILENVYLVKLSEVNVLLI